jgi:hypothetical protein
MLFANSTNLLTTNGTRIRTCFSGGRRETRGAGQKNRFRALFSAFRKPGAKLCVDAINFVFLSRNRIEMQTGQVRCLNI